MIARHETPRGSRQDEGFTSYRSTRIFPWEYACSLTNSAINFQNFQDQFAKVENNCRTECFVSSLVNQEKEELGKRNNED